MSDIREKVIEIVVDQLDAKPEDFVHVSCHTRYDPLPMHDMGFRNLVLLDRGELGRLLHPRVRDSLRTGDHDADLLIGRQREP